jgi:hypothetical protein
LIPALLDSGSTQLPSLSLSPLGILYEQMRNYVSGVYILENAPSFWGGGITGNVIWGKNMKRGREKGGKCNTKRKKGERQGKRRKKKRK